MPFADLDSVRIYYETHGQGHPLVFVSGITIDHRFWRLQVRGLQKDFQVVVFDNRDVGQTKFNICEYEIEDMANDLLALLDHLKLARIHLVGFSMGGFIAQSLAARYPDRIQSLILAGTAAKVSNRTRRIIINWLHLAASLSREQALKEMMLWTYSTKFFENEQNMKNVLQQMLTSEHMQTLPQFERQAKAQRVSDWTEVCKQIKAPTLVLVGAEERVFSVDDARQLAMLIPDAQLHVFENQAHNLFLENPVEVNEKIAAFCKKHSN
jgi:pimeloyl-ACP methyl ester carboxylesterase